MTKYSRVVTSIVWKDRCFETSVTTRSTTPRHIAEVSSHRQHRCQNLSACRILSCVRTSNHIERDAGAQFVWLFMYNIHRYFVSFRQCVDLFDFIYPTFLDLSKRNTNPFVQCLFGSKSFGIKRNSREGVFRHSTFITANPIAVTYFD
jgi:hypothetical protein